MLRRREAHRLPAVGWEARPWTLALPALLAFLVFVPALRGGFVHDDVPQVARNPLVQDLRFVPTLLRTGVWAGAGSGSSWYRPLMTTSFALDRGELSQPVRTEFGYHLIEALSPVRQAKTTPLAKVRASIRTTLLQERKNEAIQEWLDDLRDDSDVTYATGFAPPDLPELPTESATE